MYSSSFVSSHNQASEYNEIEKDAVDKGYYLLYYDYYSKN